MSNNIKHANQPRGKTLRKHTTQQENNPHDHYTHRHKTGGGFVKWINMSLQNCRTQKRESPPPLPPHTSHIFIPATKSSPSFSEQGSDVMTTPGQKAVEGMCVHSPAPEYSHPWYGHLIEPSITCADTTLPINPALSETRPFPLDHTHIHVSLMPVDPIAEKVSVLFRTVLQLQNSRACTSG